MEKVLQRFQYLEIQLEEIKSATNNFNEKNCIGSGGFGKVYKGVVVHNKGRSMAAIKRLDPRSVQGIPEFLKEIRMLSHYKHKNLISLLGFCCKGHEMILVYEHASHGSLDHHLNSPNLTWTRRLSICLDAAKGLGYLHDPRETHQRVIHCDIKSANILLDEQWIAKVSDFGLSIMGPANEHDSVIVTLAAGTLGYCDPEYALTHTLTKESDVYSLGVVLVEILCGALCYTVSNNLVPTWIKSYEEKKLNDIIFKHPTIQPLHQSSLDTLSDIVYRCLKETREDRPKMAEVVKELESALKVQEISGWMPLFDYKEMTKGAELAFLNCTSKVELWKLLSKGVLLNSGKTWFSLNQKEEHCEMISFAECLDLVPSEFKSNSWLSEYNSRFDVGPYHYKNGSVKIHVKTQFLSPLITYTVNLVFNFFFPDDTSHETIFLKYKLQGETETSISYLACKREDGWWMCELYQFTSDHNIVDLEILFDGFASKNSIVVEGIEFRPSEKVEHKDEKQDTQPILDSEANWEENLPADYEDIMKWSKNKVQWTTKKEAHSIICKGFLINDGEEWFSLDKNGKKCYMLSIEEACKYEHYKSQLRELSLPGSRFGEVFVPDDRIIKFFISIQSQLLSSHTTYASYLVYKLYDQSTFQDPIQVCVNNKNLRSYIYLVSPQTPIIRPKADQNTHNPLNRPKMKGHPQQRNDSWMEVQIWEFRTSTASKKIPMHLELSATGSGSLKEFIIQGIEFRPI